MKQRLFLIQKMALCALSFFFVACSVEDTLDLSKDIDATVAVGNGISLPLGSTEKIMLTEMIDLESSEVLDTIQGGDYVITKSDDIDETTVEINEVDVEVEPMSHSEKFDLDIIPQKQTEIENLKNEAIAKKQELEDEALKAKEDAYKKIDAEITNPALNAAAKAEADANYDAVMAEIEKQYGELVKKYQEALDSNVELGEIDHKITGEESKINYKLSVDVPEEVTEIETVQFEEPTDFTIDIAIVVEGNDKEDFGELVKTIHLYGNQEDERFFIGVPKFVVFEEGVELVPAANGEYNKLYIEGGATHKDDNNKNIKHLTRTYKILGFDFTKDDVEVENGKIEINKEYSAEGRIVANAIEVSMANALTIRDVILDATVSIGEKQADGIYQFTLKKIKGKFDPQIDPIEVDMIDLDLGEDMDFVYENGAIFDFANPQINLTINSGVALEAGATIVMHSYDDKDNPITPAEGVKIPLTIKEGKNVYNITNDFFNAGEPNLSTLLAKVPHKVEIKPIEPKIADKVQEVTLGDEMKINGAYDINIPMKFNEVKLTYTETVEDVLGDDPTEVTDYVNEIESLTVEFEALNTVPADFDVDIVALDSDNKVLKGIVAKLVDDEGKPAIIKAGKGHKEEPVATNVKIKLSAADGQIEKLCNLDIKLNGHGYNVVLNANAYITLKNLAVTIDEPIIVDMN